MGRLRERSGCRPKDKEQVKDFLRDLRIACNSERVLLECKKLKQLVEKKEECDWGPEEEKEFTVGQRVVNWRCSYHLALLYGSCTKARKRCAIVFDNGSPSMTVGQVALEKTRRSESISVAIEKKLRQLEAGNNDELEDSEGCRVPSSQVVSCSQKESEDWDDEEYDSEDRESRDLGDGDLRSVNDEEWRLPPRRMGDYGV